MSDTHPLIDLESTSLTQSQQLFVCLAAHTAKGDLDALAQDWLCLPQEQHEAGLEVILQTHLFAGYPRTINALGVIRKLGCSLNTSTDASHEQWRADGEHLCSQIYAGAYDKLRDAISALHVDLERWMIETGYGRVLSRPGLSPMEREFGVLAVLGGQNVKPQLMSHLRGALHVGATMDALKAVLKLVGEIWGEDALTESMKVFQKLKA